MDLFAQSESIDFDRFRLNLRDRSLCRRDDDGTCVPVSIGSRAFDILDLLVTHAGKLVPKAEIMNAIWPEVAVEESNLTVQISTLRRVLVEGRICANPIQTVPGRGYRFTLEVTHSFTTEHSHRKTPPPRLSVAVLPLVNVDGTPDLALLAEGIREGVTVDLAQLWYAQVTARSTVPAFRDQPVDVQMVGHSLDVRYVLGGSLCRLADRLSVTASLVSGETGEVLSLDQIDVTTSDSVEIQDEIRGWMTNFAGRQMTISESTRSVRERPNNPDALDFLLQGRALFYQRSSAVRSDAAQTLYEQALQLDPKSYRAMADLAAVISEQYAVLRRPVRRADFIRADHLISAAEALAPTDNVVLYSRAYLLRQQQRWPEAIAAFEHLRNLYPHDDRAYFLLGICKQQIGRPEEAIPLLRTTIRLNPRTSNIWSRYGRLGQALTLVGQYHEAVAWLQRALAADPELPATTRSYYRLWLASAHALGGQVDRAREEVEAARLIYPYYWSVRSFLADQNANEAYAALLDRIREGLRLAELRDHVDENAAGPSIVVSGLHPNVEGQTARTIPGARLVRTKEVAYLLETGRTLVLDAALGTRSIKGALSVAWIGYGGSLSDAVQDPLNQQLQVISHGDMSRPIVTLGVNAEHWSGYDLALRAVALGYKNVLWYRGGRDAWAAAGLPVGRLKVASPLSVF